MPLVRVSNGGTDLKFGTYTTKPALTSSYTYIATGGFVRLLIGRGGVSSAPSVQVYCKQGSTYVAVSASTSVPDSGGTGYITIEANSADVLMGELYIRRTAGSNFTPTTFNFKYIYEA